MPARASREYLAGRFVAQEARKDMRAGDAEFARGEGRARFTSASESINTDDRVAPQMTLLELRTLRFTLPMPVSVNAAWRHVSRKEVMRGMEPSSKFLTDDHKQYRSTVIGIVRGDMLRAELRAQPLLGRIELRATLYFADGRVCDVDNRVKPLQDALTHAHAYRDDSQIDRLIVERVIRPGRPEACEVTLQEIAA